MKEIILKIKISDESGKVAFIVEKNFKETANDIFSFVGILDLVKQSQLKSVGELQKKEVKPNYDDED